MTSVLKNVDVDKLVEIVHKYNNKYHKRIKMKPVDVKDNTYTDFGKEVNDKDSKFQVGDHVRISKYKNIFTKGYSPDWSEEVFIIKKLKVLFHEHILHLLLQARTKYLRKTLVCM